MTDIRQCWAFHRDGARCEHPAGHPGDHAVQKTWNDLQCATPGEFSAPATLMTDTSQALDIPMPEPMPVPPANTCIACGHKHKSGECKCGCYEFIG